MTDVIRFAISIVIALLPGALSGVAAAEPAQDAEAPAAPVTAAQSPDRRNVLRVDLGWASALGLGGVAYTRDVNRFFQFEAGVGVGFTFVQFSLCPSSRWGVGQCGSWLAWAFRSARAAAEVLTMCATRAPCSSSTSTPRASRAARTARWS